MTDISPFLEYILVVLNIEINMIWVLRMAASVAGNDHMNAVHHRDQNITLLGHRETV